MRKKAYGKDIRRTILHSGRRFFAIMVITILGVTMFSGLTAACEDLRRSADTFFDGQKLHDLTVTSTMGLTEEDLQMIAGGEGVLSATGIYGAEVTAKGKSADLSAVLKTIPEDGTDALYLLEGRLPEKIGEAAVTEKFLHESGCSVGDTISVKETGDQNVFKRHSFTITAAVTDPTSVNNPDGSVSYRDSGASVYSVYVPESAAKASGDSAYMSVLIRVEGTESLLCYSKEYDTKTGSVKDWLEDDVADAREQARLDGLQSDAREDLETERLKAQKKIDDAKEQLEEAQAQAAAYGMETPAEVTAGLEELEEQQEELDSRMEDAEQEIQDMDRPVWYVQDRTSMAGYQNIGSDADSIEAIAAVFPVVFFIVAVLISLTAVTRMVEEERGLIGTYKALGYTDAEIQEKYLFYSFSASAAGSVIGTLAAFLLLPAFIFTIFRTMYLLPEYHYSFVWRMGIAGPALFIGGILLATVLSCRAELSQTPAALMRPKAPRIGSRILLEKITPFWHRLSFLNKVTARNLFRYKKRLFMTIFGIAGCMALLLFGFGIRDSVHDLSPLQYEDTFHYDLMAAGSADDNDRILEAADEDASIASYINAEITSAEITYGDEHISATLLVFPDDLSDEELSSYLSFRDHEGNLFQLGKNDIFITVNAGNVLGFGAGDTVSLSLTDLTEANLTATRLVENYLGNYVYMRAGTFQKYLETCEPNGILGIYTKDTKDADAVTDAFSEKDGVLTCIGTRQLQDSFSTAFQMINAVVYIIILMSAALAFVVLFTLQTTNISERERELATIKVLGFYDREVHLYVNKESAILTVLGIIPGLPLGYAFAQTLVTILNLPAIYFKVSLHGISYVYAVLLTLVFAAVVDVITDRVLNRIDPVSALKSVE